MLPDCRWLVGEGLSWLEDELVGRLDGPYLNLATALRADSRGTDPAGPPIPNQSTKICGFPQLELGQSSPHICASLSPSMY